MVSLPNRRSLGILVAAIVAGYIVGLAIIALVQSPAASLDTATSPVYLIAVTIGTVAFTQSFLKTRTAA
ncbi:hypothetical protein SAMN04487950_3712 [Halogranum rubrum]|uniref:Uncharacterized protein n=1 Tax=Halogranum rubrum TaxID=553466 RepID=A0A1I4HHN0_9EURY|nr:hypothetical protein SAMN04487950_3712 [Halogranum rubrum]